MSDSLYVGLMSGTSIDSIDAALINCQNHEIALLETHEHAIPAQVQQRIAALSHSGENEIEAMGVLDRELGALFATATLALLSKAGCAADSIIAIGSHGQTIRHRPVSAGHSPEHAFTLQIGDPNTIAETTGITTVADFRRRDIAAGGEGAPLAPAFHAAAFAKPGVNRAIVNIGGIANATLLAGNELCAGFDTGPGNTLLDHWIERFDGSKYDQDGRWSSEGQTIDQLYSVLMQEEYFARLGPRSTGKELFNLAWLEPHLAQLTEPDPRNVQTTLAEVTAQSIAGAIAGHEMHVDEVYVCGGGARNTDLMRRLYQKVSPAILDSTAALGMEPEWVEAAAFAWFAHRTVEGAASNAPVVTGSAGLRVLGGIFRA
jgi:anhydro-N-acetylmuramic acid kinase